VRVAKAARADSIFVSADASEYAQARERGLARECGRERIELRTVAAASVVPPGLLAATGSDHYRVFTPYWRRWQPLPAPLVCAPPSRLLLPPGLEPGDLPPLRELSGAPPSPDLPRGGERPARRRLERWLADGLPGYERNRDRLDLDATSRLSPYLHLGCLSAAEVVTRAREREGAQEFVRQLAWRDFYHQLLAAHPRTPREDLRPRGDEWTRDDEPLARWREGQTGCAVVDAAMRQLAREGWMPGRARLIVGSYLTKTLRVDWRHGARVFSEMLVDADLASNVGNWQWVAGTGVDTRPNRVLNPLRQAKRFDPEGAYVRRYVPELS
jgi:deoxyribodipyrimidine photo-lyase